MGSLPSVEPGLMESKPESGSLDGRLCRCYKTDCPRRRHVSPNPSLARIPGLETEKYSSRRRSSSNRVSRAQPTIHSRIALVLVGLYNRALLPGCCSYGPWRSRAVRDFLGPRNRPLTDFLHHHDGTSKRRFSLSLRDPVLKIKILCLDISRCNHVLLLSV